MRQTIDEFWVNSHKHVKVLGRGMELLVLIGLQFDRARLSRLWFAQINGAEPGPRGESIFGMGAMTRAISEHVGQSARETWRSRREGRSARTK